MANNPPIPKEKDKKGKRLDTKTNRKKLHDKLWDLRSILIRKKEKKCYTCGAQIWNEELGEWDIRGLQAGHFRHGVLDFDDMNIHAQCRRCNHYLSGNGTEYARRLTRQYGAEAVEALNVRADMALKGELHSYQWYLEQIELINHKLSCLK